MPGQGGLQAPPTPHLSHAPAKQAAAGLTYLHRQVVRHGEAGHGWQSAVRVGEGCVCSAQHGARGKGGNCRERRMTNSCGESQSQGQTGFNTFLRSMNISNYQAWWVVGLVGRHWC